MTRDPRDLEAETARGLAAWNTGGARARAAYRDDTTCAEPDCPVRVPHSINLCDFHKRVAANARCLARHHARKNR